jgi:hypothetical protein
MDKQKIRRKVSGQQTGEDSIISSAKLTNVRTECRAALDCRSKCLRDPTRVHFVSNQQISPLVDQGSTYADCLQVGGVEYYLACVFQSLRGAIPLQSIERVKSPTRRDPASN